MSKKIEKIERPMLMALFIQINDDMLWLKQTHTHEKSTYVDDAGLKLVS